MKLTNRVTFFNNVPSGKIFQNKQKIQNFRKFFEIFRIEFELLIKNFSIKMDVQYEDIEIVECKSNMSNMQQKTFEHTIKEIDAEVNEIERQILKLKRRKNELLKTKHNLIQEKTDREAEVLAKSHNWESLKNFPWSSKLESTLKEKFKMSNFRPLQLSAINATLELVTYKIGRSEII